MLILLREYTIVPRIALSLSGEAETFFPLQWSKMSQPDFPLSETKSVIHQSHVGGNPEVCAGIILAFTTERSFLEGVLQVTIPKTEQVKTIAIPMRGREEKITASSL